MEHLDNAITFLKGQSTFENLSMENLRIVAELTRSASYLEGTVVAEEGDDAGDFYLIKSGKVSIAAISDRDYITVTELEENCVFGWSWFIPPYKWTFSARTLKDTELYVVDGKVLREKCAEKADLGFQLMGKIAEISSSRLIETRKQLADYYKRYKNDLKMW